MAPSGREAAFDVLLRIEDCRHHLKQLVETAERGLDSRESAFCRELSYGVQRHRGVIDRTLSRFLKKPLSGSTPEVRTALRLGAYQILFLSRVPPHAAVNESVRLVKRGFGGQRMAGFVNGVLRNLIRDLEASGTEMSVLSEGEKKVEKIDPDTLSHPGWLVDRWIARYGPTEAVALCRANNEIPSICLRTNLLRTNREDLLSRLADSGISATPSPIAPAGIRLAQGTAVRAIPEDFWGFFQVQDDAAQLIAPLIDPRPGERILDACAAPGGKTTHLAELTDDRAEIVAVDRDPDRLRLLDDRVVRLGLKSIRTVPMDLLAGDENDLGLFDKILLDAPCSALGVIRRNPDIKWCRRREDLSLHQETQIRLLGALARYLKPGGRLLYAVCSTEPEEGEDVIDSFTGESALDGNEYQVTPAGRDGKDKYFRTLPHRDDADGFFAAILDRQ